MSTSSTGASKIDSFFDEEPMFLYNYLTLEILDVNRACLEKYGFSKEEFRLKKIQDLGKKYQSDDELLNGNTPSIWVHSAKDGTEFYVQLTLHPFKYRDENVQLAIAHDISPHIDHLSKNLHRLPRIEGAEACIPLGMIEWDRNGQIRNWSDYAEKIFGWKFKDLAGENLFEKGILTQSVKQKILAQIDELEAQKQNYFSFDSNHITKSGKEIYCTWHNGAVYDQRGKLVSIYTVVEDISQKREIQEQHTESEQRFRVLSDASQVGVYMMRNRRLIYVNPRFCQLIGYSHEDVMSKFDPIKLIHPEDQPKLVRLKELWNNTEIDSFEVNIRVLNRQSDLLHIKLYGSKIMMNDKPTMMGVVVDQTSEVEASENYKQSVQSYKALFDSIGDSIYIQNEEGIIIEVNQSIEKMYGYKKKEIVGRDAGFLTAPDKMDEDKIRNHFMKAFKGVPQRYEWWGIRKNGEVFPKSIHLNPGTYFGENVVIAIARDISEQYEQQKILRENETLFRQLFQNAPVGIALLDEQKKVQMVNEGFEEVFGYTFDEIRGLNIDSVIAPADHYDEAALLSASTKAFEVSATRIHKDGHFVDVLIYGVPVVLDKKTIAIYGIYVDITDRIEAEEKIRHSLKEKEVLLSEIHHRVKNNLAVIIGLLELQSHNTESEDAQKALKDSQMRINSMALIHEKLYQNDTLSQIEFDVYIKELIDVIQKSHFSSHQPVKVNLDLDKIAFTITQAIPCGLLLSEVVTNALKHAFPQTYKGTAQISVSLKLEGNSQVRLTISDNGIGMSGSFEELGQQSLGLTLIETLKSQIEAKMEVDGKNGTSYTFKFVKEDFEQV